MNAEIASICSVGHTYCGCKFGFGFNFFKLVSFVVLSCFKSSNYLRQREDKNAFFPPRVTHNILLRTTELNVAAKSVERFWPLLLRYMFSLKIDFVKVIALACLF